MKRQRSRVPNEFVGVRNSQVRPSRPKGSLESRKGVERKREERDELRGSSEKGSRIQRRTGTKCEGLEN